MIKKLSLLVGSIVGLFLLTNGQTQTGISGMGINTNTIDNSAVLDVVSNNKGVLIPRMTTTQRNNIATPATGLLVYDLTLNQLFYYNGSSWLGAHTSVQNNDTDTSNELQTISRTGTTVTLNNGGGTFTDSVNTQNLADVIGINNAANGQIKSVTDPTAAQDVSTKIYVDAVETRLDSLLTELNRTINVQDSLDAGITPCALVNTHGLQIDSLYGKTYRGGLIFYFDPGDCRGLVSASTDQSAGSLWGCEWWSGETIPYNSSPPIINNINYSTEGNPCNEANSASQHCAELVLNGYTDWYLPSLPELDLMYNKLYLNNLGSFSPSRYWSSTFFGDFTSPWDGIDKYARVLSFANHTFSLSSVQNSRYVRAIRPFNSDPIVLPTLTTTAISSNNFYNDIGTAISGGNITSNGNASVIARGICWSKLTDPTTPDSCTTDGIETGSFTSNITGLDSSTTYYVRAFATNNSGTAYGNEVTFTTPTPVLPSIDGSIVSVITPFQANVSSNITSDGLYPVTSRGFCYSTSINPTILDDKTNNGTGIGAFNTTITNLTQNTTYYVRSYAITNMGVAYGNETNFTTIITTIPVLSTTAISTELYHTATSGGTISDSGYVAITAKGVCWSTSPNPTVSDNLTNDGTSISSFGSSLTGLTQSTTYYVRSYATNSVGTGYGNEISFTALTAALPTLTTTAATGWRSVSFNMGGNVSAHGGTEVTARGLVWNTSPSPTTANNSSSNGTGTGSYAQVITGVTLGTTYYVRAYATNLVGTTYGNEITVRAEYQLKEPVQGGYVFYLDGTNLHGKAAAPADIGSSNHGPAITACLNHDDGTYSDWTLPTVSEWSLIQANLYPTGNFCTCIFWALELHPWYGGAQAYDHYPYFNNTGNSSITNNYNIRPVRNF